MELPGRACKRGEGFKIKYCEALIASGVKEKEKEKLMWIRYRFETKETKDYRPLIFNAKYPWWCSGVSDESAVIVAYLPKDENLHRYWDDAFNIETEEKEEITFTSRFPKPDYFKGEKQ